MTDRYFSEAPILEDRAVLVGPEAHHLAHVMRAKPGTRVVLFDGSGAEFAAEVKRIERNKVELAVLRRVEVDRELPMKLTLGVALPKGDRQKWLVEKAVELGVSRLVPLQTARSVAQPRPQALGRLRRTVIEASKQCGRNRLLEIAEPQAWAEFVAETEQTPCRLLADQHAHQDASTPLAGYGIRTCPPAALPQAGTSSAVLLAVGPEGGFTAEEVSLATAAGWRSVNLGPRTLRVETAAFLLVAMVIEPNNV